MRLFPAQVPHKEPAAPRLLRVVEASTVDIVSQVVLVNLDLGNPDNIVVRTLVLVLVLFLGLCVCVLCL